MFAAFSRSWELVKASYGVLRSDKELVIFPIISFIGVVIVSISFFVPMLAAGMFDGLTNSDGEGGVGIATLIVTFLFYLVMYTVIIFCKSALIGAALIRLKGGDPPLQDGFNRARERIGTLVGYAAISATVGIILQLLSNAFRGNKNPIAAIIGQIIVGLIGAAWNIVTFLAVPVLVVENVGPIECVKRSGALLKKTWGEQLAGNFGVGAVFGLITFGVIILGVVLIAVFASLKATVLVVLAIIAMIIAIAAISLLASTLGGIYQAALYRYATEGEVSSEFSPDMIRGAFVQKSGAVGGF